MALNWLNGKNETDSVSGMAVCEVSYLRDNGSVVPDWLPPFLAAVLIILLLNLALFEQGRRARRRSWDVRLLRELRAWDGRLPDEFDRPRKRSR
jgi:hypothetical protein